MSEYLTTREVAAHLRINEKKVYDLVAHGQLPAARVSGKWLFPRRLIDQWVERNTVFREIGLMGALLDQRQGRAEERLRFLPLHPFPDAGATGAPATYEQTLNRYGLAYKNAGRSAAAVRTLASQDSDGDGYSNADEIADLRYPGSADSKPGQARAKILVLDLAELKAMPAHQEFLLANASKQQFDTYASYGGVKVRDLLTAVGVDPAGVTGVTVISADGFTKDFAIDVGNARHPAALFYSGLDTGTRGADCGFVEYPLSLPAGLVNGGAIPDEQ